MGHYSRGALGNLPDILGSKSRRYRQPLKGEHSPNSQALFILLKPEITSKKIEYDGKMIWYQATWLWAPTFTSGMVLTCHLTSQSLSSLGLIVLPILQRIKCDLMCKKDHFLRWLLKMTLPSTWLLQWHFSIAFTLPLNPGCPRRCFVQ